MSKRLKVEFSFEKDLPWGYLSTIADELNSFIKKNHPDLPIEKVIIDWSPIKDPIIAPATWFCPRCKEPFYTNEVNLCESCN